MTSGTAPDGVPGGGPTPTRVAVVGTGGGARGAYEAGALRAVVPALVARGQRPRIVVGTSAGAINAVLLGSLAHRLGTAGEAGAALDEVVAAWHDVALGQVFRPLATSGWATAVRYAAAAAGLPRPRLTALLDTAPLRELAARAVDWAQLHRNVRDGLADVAVVTTTARGGTCIFLQRGGTEAPQPDPTRGWEYRSVDLGPEHLCASSAIPLLFPPVEIEGDWYSDGGLRLNAPLKPALDLGADGLVVAANHSVPYDVGTACEPPQIDDAAAQVLSAVLSDRMLEDLRRLRSVNELLEHIDPDAATDKRRVPSLVVTAPQAGALAGLAEQAYADVSGSLLSLLRHADVPLLHHLLAPDDSRGAWELLSYLFFDPAFTRRAVALGRDDASHCVPASDDDCLPWCLTEPVPDLAQAQRPVLT